MFIPTRLSLLGTFLDASLGTSFNSTTYFFEIPWNWVLKDVCKQLVVNLSQATEIRWQIEGFIASINYFSFLGENMTLMAIPKESNEKVWTKDVIYLHV